ncbi:MAG TPA: methyltransferase [Solirubrobacteraceae bacterium]|jgi:DNA-binding transcriptional ArsR family regulator
MARRLPPRPVARAGLRVRGVLLRAADALLPSDVALIDQSWAFYRSLLLGVVAELGVPDQLAAGPRSAAQIAAALDLDADYLHRALRVLAVHGVVRLDRAGRFRLTRVGRHLTSADARSLRPWVRYLNLPSTQSACAALTDALRTGEPPFPAVHGRSVWDHFAAHPDEERLFAAAMRQLTRIELSSIVGGYPWPQRGTVCDVAGGVGTVLVGILRARPRLQGKLVDAPGVLREAEDHLVRAGVRARVELEPGDIFERVEAAADVYVLKDVLHDWDDARSARILATVRAAMRPGARVVLVERLQERNEPDPVASVVDVHMLTQCDGGRQRSVGELRELLRGAGLEPGAAYLSAGPALVEGVATR